MSDTAKHLQTGRRGEEAAARYLRQQGFTILHTNWRCHPYELDIVAMDGTVLVFVEVRTRSSRAFGEPEETVDQRKQQKLADAAEAFLDAHPHTGEIRFDIVAILSRGNTTRLRHIRDAFFPGQD